MINPIYAKEIVLEVEYVYDENNEKKYNTKALRRQFKHIISSLEQ